MFFGQEFYVGIHFETRQFALLCKEKNQIKIEHLDTASDNVKPLYILETLLSGKSYQYVTGLSASDVLLRSLHLELTKRKEIFQALPFQVEELVPIEEEERIVLPTLYQTKELTNIFLIASSKKSLANHLEKASTFGIEPDIVSCIPLALFRFARQFYSAHAHLIVYDTTEHTFVIIKEGKLHASQRLKEDEFSRMCAYFQKKHPEIKHILFTGEKILKTNDFIILETNDDIQEEYAIPIGLALDALIADKQSSQFLQTKISKRMESRRKFHFLKYYITCATACILMLTLGISYLHKKEKIICENIGEKGKLVKVIQAMQNTITKQNKITVKQQTTPTAHETLAWLSNHPLLQENVSIKRLRYDLSTKPKVEIDLETSSPEIARKFRAALVNDRTYLDRAKEVKWHSEYGRYRAIFYLKQKKDG